ncbi:hypothetical protein LA20531_09240 [Lactobacillus amylovorus DSM 20531]|uniref:hypothetical protein n=1 Tax=Lactobacillus amylovorus TaxID=1604 RepID=UPI000AD067B5|nr:hypothetical protein [Lactobacillus amylovorus]ATO53761.1 hypothetical protein LA20531_09240 [Lactobacillus amylovorus DSM 20531]MCT3592225.1 hypothetical protein [Lactobacillus amylovorus]
MKHQQVRNFFKEDYPRLALLATGRCLSESSVKTIKVNISEKGGFAYYQNVYALASTTIAELENTAVHPYRTLIIEHYIKHTRLKDLEPLIGFKHSATCKKINEALVCFANEYNKQADRYNLEFRFQLK